MRDLCFYDYKIELSKKLCEKHVEKLTTKPAGRGLRLDSGYVSWIPHPGYTIPPNPYPLAGSENRDKLKAIQKTLSTDVTGFVPVPSLSFHMTIAGLISGVRFSRLSTSDKRNFVETVIDILPPHASCRKPITGRIVGVGSFPGVVIALVDFENKVAYKRIIKLRDRIYDASSLAASPYGVARNFPFQGHINLDT